MNAHLTVAVALLIAAPALAQSPTPTVWLEAGRSEFDLAGNGTASLLNARGDLAFGKHLIAEAGLGHVRAQQSSSEVSYALTDVELQLQLPMGHVRPYVGVGMGQLIVLSETPYPTSNPLNSPDGYDAALVTVSMGARITLSGPLHARIGARLRGSMGDGPDVFSSTLGELTMGAGYRF